MTVGTQQDQFAAVPGVIVDGWAILFLECKPVCFLGRGDCLPLSLFEKPMTVKPVGPLQIERVAGPAAREVSPYLLQSLARHAARLSDSALARTADFLLELAEKIDRSEIASVQFSLPIPQTDLAVLLGMSAVHMSRTLKALKAMNVLGYDHGVFTIHDRTHLAELAAGS
jgi:hypothetical protein